MGSMSNPNPWAPYDSYTDCSQGICNIYCPQWCYLIFPPPPSFFLDDEDNSSSSPNFSPLLIALIGILVSAFVLVSYYTLISKYCHRRESSSEAPGHDRVGVYSSAAESRQVISNASAAGGGLNDSLIKSITVYKYRKGDGFVDGSDCSVCLSEFEENENLRLLPKCNHAFHLPCIDTWLKSHSNCPLCRAFVTGINSTTEAVSVANQTVSVPQVALESGNRSGGTVEINSTLGDHQYQTGDSVLVIDDQEISRSEPAEEEGDTKDEAPQQIQRAVSLDSGTVVSIANILREMEDDERDEECAGVGTSQQRRDEGEENKQRDGRALPPTEAGTTASQGSGVSSFLSVAMKRYDQARPN